MTTAEFLKQQHRIEEKLEAILALARFLVKKEIRNMAKLDDILAKVTAQGTSLDSINTLISGLQGQIAAAGLSPADQAKVDTIFADLSANDAKIAAALAANVPPPPPPAPPAP